MRRREPAQPHIVDQLGARVGDLGISFFERQILREGQRIDAEGHIASGQIGLDLGGHHARVGAGHIDVHVVVRGKRVDDALPALNLLHLVQEQVAPLSARQPALDLGVHLLRRHIRVFHGIETVADDLLIADATLAQLLHQHQQDRGLSAAAHAGQNLDKRRVDVGHNAVHIVGTVNHAITSSQL